MPEHQVFLVIRICNHTLRIIDSHVNANRVKKK